MRDPRELRVRLEDAQRRFNRATKYRIRARAYDEIQLLAWVLGEDAFVVDELEEK